MCIDYQATAGCGIHFSISPNRKKKVRRQILGSDEDFNVVVSSSEDSSSDVFVNRPKKRAKKSNSGRDSTSDTDTG